MYAIRSYYEGEFIAGVNAKPELKQKYGSAWKTVAEITARRQIDVRRRYHSANAYGSRLIQLAIGTVRYPAEMAKPDADRLASYQDKNKARLEQALFDDGPIDLEQEKALLTAFP